MEATEKTAEKTIKLRVKKHVLLPHVIGVPPNQITFKPDAEVTETRGKALLKSWPGVYELATGDPDLAQYKMKDIYRDTTIADIMKGLPSRDQLEVLDHAKTLANGKEYSTGIPEETDVVKAFKALPADQQGEALGVLEAHKAGELRIVQPEAMTVQDAYDKLKAKDKKQVDDLLKSLAKD